MGKQEQDSEMGTVKYTPIWVDWDWGKCAGSKERREERLNKQAEAPYVATTMDEVSNTDTTKNAPGPSPVTLDNSGHIPLQVPGFKDIPIHYELPSDARFAHGIVEWR
ncbi:hypothetical protein N7449_000880 [Penicillium cf. viridicatum]|uniref:Uncharacterized protein n=1 Tax=Penicillium cf. viridicatum TaxID=2972119 RepID=A0A9W9T8X6_9EURO|nr:hypothetical protein N7449_000880 [Penicillium cf. viridicatum]